VSVSAGWVARLGHVCGKIFMFDVVVVGGEHSRLSDRALPSRPYSIFYADSCWVVLRASGRAGKHECEQDTWPLRGEGFLVVGGRVVQASSRRTGSAAGHSPPVTRISLEALGQLFGPPCS
jgi:hypothetical protein